MKSNAQGQDKNYLDYIPVPGKQVRYEISEGKVTIYQENRGMFNRIFQVLLKKPKISQIHLDEMGNFIWPLMDGKRSILDIAEQVKEQFGEKAEPLYPRLVKYFQMLKDYGFVEFCNEEEK